MQSKVSVESLFFTIYVTAFFLPSYFSNSLTSALSNILLFSAIAVLLFNKYLPSKFVILMFMYFVYLLAITYYNKTDMANIHTISSYIKITTFVATIEYMLLKRAKETINIIFIVLLVFVTADFLSLIIFPNGLYQTRLVWSRWYSSTVAQWLYGNKNNRVYWYIMLLLVSSWRYNILDKHKSHILSIGIMIMSIVAMIIAQSSTATVVILISVAAIWFGEFRKKPIKGSFNIYILLASYLVLVALIVGGSATFLSPIVSGVFGKDMTFTSRTTAWNQVLSLIRHKPFMGWGMVGGNSATELLGSLTFVNAHNQILNILWQGGILLFLIMSSIIALISKEISLLKDLNKKMMMTLLLFSILVDMIFEVILGISATWILLYLIYQECNMSNRQSAINSDNQEIGL